MKCPICDRGMGLNYETGNYYCHCMDPEPPKLKLKNPIPSTNHPSCPSCSVPWDQHLGIEGTCRELQRSKDELAELEFWLNGEELRKMKAEIARLTASNNKQRECIQKMAEAIDALHIDGTRAAEKIYNDALAAYKEIK